MENITKNDVRKVLNNFGIYRHEVFTLDDNDTSPKIHYIEYYIWYGMLISFIRKKPTQALYVKFEGEIPISLLEYIEKKYPYNEIETLYPKNEEDMKNCYKLLINNIYDLYLFLKESKDYWLNMEDIEKTFLDLDEETQIKKLIP